MNVGDAATEGGGCNRAMLCEYPDVVDFAEHLTLYALTRDLVLVHHAAADVFEAGARRQQSVRVLGRRVLRRDEHRRHAAGVLGVADSGAEREGASIVTATRVDSSSPRSSGSFTSASGGVSRVPHAGRMPRGLSDVLAGAGGAPPVGVGVLVLVRGR